MVVLLSPLQTELQHVVPFWLRKLRDPEGRKATALAVSRMLQQLAQVQARWSNRVAD